VQHGRKAKRLSGNGGSNQVRTDVFSGGAEISPQRTRIRLAAVHLFSRRGYEATSMKQLAQEIGMVPANLYNYYAKKEDILLDVLNSTLVELIERERAIVAEQEDPVAQLRTLALDLVLSDLRDPLAAFVAHHGLNGLVGDAHDQISELRAEVRQIWLAAVRRGVEGGVFTVSDPKLCTLTILTVCSFVTGWFDRSGTHTEEDVARYTALAILRILGVAEPR
jgi:AcrR family transcriptional regulator